MTFPILYDVLIATRTSELNAIFGKNITRHLLADANV
jgi:hypothetical protein